MRKLAADVIIVKHGKILLIKRADEPFKGEWGLPGGHIDEGETIEDAALREAREETGLNVKLESFVGIFSDPKRDPRGTISVTYSATVIDGELTENSEVEDIKWFEITKLPPLFSDHKKIVQTYFGYD
ncbi:MAG: NUDIX hydrolase [Candidatus Altiarchaeota archaeon]|nr:NUDIX hydrolase [Candidatus Altiarchaeota archaeon]